MSNEEVIQEIEEEIKKVKGEPEEFQIEITEDPAEEAKDVAEEAVEEKKAEPEQDPEYGEKVQKRIKKLVDQRREAEIQARQIQEQNAQLSARLERLEQGSKKSSENQFNQRYAETKAALTKAVEEGDTITEGVEIGRCVSATFHLGTVTTIPTSNPGVYEIQAGNPDGTWNDIGTQISIAVTTGFMDSVTISNPPDLLRLKQSGAAPDDAEYNILIEAHSSNV